VDPESTAEPVLERLARMAGDAKALLFATLVISGTGALAGLSALAVFGLTAIGSGFAFARIQKERAETARAVQTLTRHMRNLDPAPIGGSATPEWREAVAAWNRDWPERQAAIAEAQNLVAQTRTLPEEFEARFGSIARAADAQEEAVEETASLVAHMRQTMTSIGAEVERLLSSSDESASAILELGGSIDEVANNTATLHELVDASTSSVHQMSASIRQVSSGAEQVQEMAETTAAAVTQMDRSVQEVSNNAIEAASLTEQANEGASRGREAVHATIRDIEQISSLTSQAMNRLDGLVTRISQIGSILSAIDEINDETKLLSLNAAIIAAQAGEQGKAFLVVANHVKTLARRTSSSTHDIEKLIEAIGEESNQAVDAMKAGIEAVAGGVKRSRDAGVALESIQDSCGEASQRVSEIARATAEQSRNSKGVAEATLQTSTQIQQISEAIAEQRRASEAMLENSESALNSCLLVHRSTDEQRQTSRHITDAIGAIGEMIREIGDQTKVHAEASEAVGTAVMSLLDNAQASGAGVGPLQSLISELDEQAARSLWPSVPPPAE